MTDKAISRYYWMTRGRDIRESITEFLQALPTRLLSDWDLYTINDRIGMDFVGRFEKLVEDLGVVAKKLGISEDLTRTRPVGSTINS